jgi:hypothetical protein
LVKSFLEENGYPVEKIERIVKIVENISFKNELAGGQELYSK